MGALIIGQSITMQTMHGMDVLGGENTQVQAEMTYDFWSNAISSLCDKITNTYGYMATKANEYGPTIKTELQQKTMFVKDAYRDMYNAVAAQDQYRNKPGFRLIPGIGLCDALNDGAKSLYANTATWYRNYAPHLFNSMREISNKDFWTKALPIVQNNAIQFIQNIKSAPDAVEQIIENKADVIIDALAKKAVFSVTKYGLAVAAGLFATYKACIYCSNKYQAYQKEQALNESIRHYITDEKIAEIEQVTGKELSSNDVQEIINNVKTKVAACEDDHCVTQAIVDLEIKEYVAQHKCA